MAKDEENYEAKLFRLYCNYRKSLKEIDEAITFSDNSDEAIYRINQILQDCGIS